VQFRVSGGAGPSAMEEEAEDGVARGGLGGLDSAVKAAALAICISYVLFAQGKSSFIAQKARDGEECLASLGMTSSDITCAGTNSALRRSGQAALEKAGSKAGKARRSASYY